MSTNGAAVRLNTLLAEAGLEPLDGKTVSQFDAYLSLFIRWNECFNLTAVRDQEGIISRHIIESIMVARFLPKGITTLLDFGSGAGLPGIPIAICRPEVAVTLAESQGKKAAFLQEAVRVLGIRATVHAQRAETLRTTFHCVVLRAVDKMPKAVAAAARLVAPGGWLAPMTTSALVAQLQGITGSLFCWRKPIRLPGSESRLLALGQKISS